MDLNRSVFQYQIICFQETKQQSQRICPRQHCNPSHRGLHRVKGIYTQHPVTSVNGWIIWLKKTKMTKWARTKSQRTLKIFQSRTWIKLVVTVVAILLTFAMASGMKLASEKLKLIFFLLLHLNHFILVLIHYEVDEEKPICSDARLILVSHGIPLFAFCLL